MNLSIRPFITLLSLATLACTATPTRSCYHSNQQIEQSIGYCQAVAVGDTLHVSGSVGAGSMSEAIKMAYDEVRRTLTAHQMDFEDVVSETVYTTNIDQLIAHQDVRKSYYGEIYPASSWVQVERLFLPEFVIEVEVTAMRGSGPN